MKYPNPICCVCLLITLAMMPQGFASSWECRYAGRTRHVDIVYPEAPVRLPCAVVYRKPDENGVDRTLWEARQDEGFCDRKATELVAKLASQGWDCSADDPGSATASTSTQRFDTEPGHPGPEDSEPGFEYHSGYFVTASEYLAFDQRSKRAFVSGVVDSRLRMWRWDLLAARYNGTPPNDEFDAWRQGHVKRLDECARRHSLTEFVEVLDSRLSGNRVEPGKDRQEKSAAMHLQAALAWFCNLHG